MIVVQMDIRDELKPVDWRLAILENHVGQADIYLKNKEKKREPKTKKSCSRQ